MCPLEVPLYFWFIFSVYNFSRGNTKDRLECWYVLPFWIHFLFHFSPKKMIVRRLMCPELLFEDFHYSSSHAFPVSQIISCCYNWMWRAGNLWGTLTPSVHSSWDSQALVSSGSYEGFMSHEFMLDASCGERASVFTLSILTSLVKTLR